MSRKYKFGDPDGLFFVSFAVVYWIGVFIKNEYKDILLDSWNYCIKNKGLEIFSWCIITSHVHMIMAANNNKPENIIRDMKRFSSTQLRKAINESSTESRREWMIWMMERAGKKNMRNKGFQFWQQDNHPIQLETNEMMQQKLDYIHNNPVEAGFVDSPEDYLYSSARDYAGEKGLIAISFID